MKRKRVRVAQSARARRHALHAQRTREVVSALQDVFGNTATVQVLSWGDPDLDPLYRRRRP